MQHILHLMEAWLHAGVQELCKGLACCTRHSCQDAGSKSAAIGFSSKGNCKGAKAKVKSVPILPSQGWYVLPAERRQTSLCTIDTLFHFYTTQL